MPLVPRSPLFYASVGLAILAFGAPGRAHAEMIPVPENPPAITEPVPAPNDIATPPTDEVPTYHRPSRWDMTRIEAAIGVRFGSFTLNGDSSGAAIPFHFDLGVRKNRWILFGSYDVLGVTAHVPSATPGDTSAPRADGTAADLGDGSGLAHRLGANARYVFGRAGESDGGFEAWVEGGIGVQHMRWDAGGTWTRPDLALGIGGTIVGLTNHRHGGFSLGIRVMLAPRNDTANRPPVCGGPCDTATPPASVDRAFLFDISVPFGT